jgi:hypothetical protein
MTGRQAGRQLRSKKAGDTVSSEECTQYGQAWESEDSTKMLEQGESTGTVVGEQTGDVIQDLGNNELETISAEDDVEITLGPQVATSSGENMQISTRTGPDNSSTQIQGDLLWAIWQAMKLKENKDEDRERRHDEYRLETKRKDEDRERRNEKIRLKDREERQRERAADILRTTELFRAEQFRAEQFRAEQFRAELECFNDRILEKLGQETKKLSDSVKSVKQQAQQQIQAVNGRVDGLVESMNYRFVELDEHVSERIVEMSDGMNERLDKVTESVDSRFKSVASEIKQSRHELIKDIEVNTKEVINKELASFKEAIAENNQNNLSKINELSSRVINLQDKVSTISCFHQSKSTADSQVVGPCNVVRSTTAEARMPTCVNEGDECVEFTGTDDVGISGRL